MTAGPRWRSMAVPYAALRLAGQALEFIGWVVLARRLDPSGFGELSIVYLVCRYFGLVADWGALWRGARDVAADGRHGSPQQLVRRRALLAPLLAAATALVLLVTGRGSLVPIVLVIVGFGLARDWIALGRGEPIRAGVPPLLQGVILVAGACLVTTVPATTVVVGTAFLVGALVSVALNRLGPEAAPSASPVGGDAWILAAYLAIQVLSTVDIVLLGLLRSTSEAGIYAAVYRFPNAWLAVIGALLASLAPAATRAFHEDRDAFRALVHRSLRTSLAVGAAVVLSTPLAVWLAMRLLGPAYEDGRAAVVVLTIATAVITVASPLHPLALATGRDRAYATAVIGCAAFNIVANLVVIPIAGMVGAASTTLAAQVVLLLVLWRLMKVAVDSAPLAPHDAADGPPEDA